MEKEDRMSVVECPCGKKWEVWKSGKGYEEFRQHLREEAKLLTGEQWVEAANRIEKSRERKKTESANGATGS